MANKKKNSRDYKTAGLFSIYGVRASKDGKRINISIVQSAEDESEERTFGCISIPMNGTKVVKVKKFNDYEVVLGLPRLDIAEIDD